jgi:hypothetical protein
MLQLTQDELLDAISRMIDTPSPLFTGRVHLYQTTAGSNPSVLTDFLEATFSGYPSNGNALTWDGPRAFGAGNLGATARTVFDGTDPGPTEGDTITNEIRGYYLTDSTNTVLLGYEDFGQVVTMSGALTQLDLDVNLQIDPLASYGQCEINV